MNCKPYNECYEFINETRQVVVCEDKKSSTKYIYKNNSSNHLSKYKVDSCLISNTKKRCDFLLLNCSKKIAYFIELKGSDLIKAVEQIDSSIMQLHPNFQDYSVEARIVLTRINTTDLKKMKLIKLEQKIKNLKGTLIKKTKEFSESN